MSATRWTAVCCTVAGALVALAVGGCSDAGAPSGGDVIPSAEVQDIGEAAGDEVDQGVAAAGSVTLETSAPFLPFRPLAAGCADVTGSTDSDNDGAPDNATFTFALPACHFTGYRGGSLDVTGAIVLSDPTPMAADFAYQATLNDFTWSFTSPGGGESFSAVRNGTRVLTGDAAGLSLSNTVTVVRTYPVRAQSTVTHNLLLQFTPAAGETLESGQPLPDGTITKSRTLTWSRSGLSRTFTVTTAALLVWDASCITDRKITSGEIHLTLADGGYVRMVWSGCGVDPERTFVPAA
jgi:hypothetical protein